MALSTNFSQIVQDYLDGIEGFNNSRIQFNENFSDIPGKDVVNGFLDSLAHVFFYIVTEYHGYYDDGKFHLMIQMKNNEDLYLSFKKSRRGNLAIEMGGDTIVLADGMEFIAAYFAHVILTFIKNGSHIPTTYEGDTAFVSMVNRQIEKQRAGIIIYDDEQEPYVEMTPEQLSDEHKEFHQFMQEYKQFATMMNASVPFSHNAISFPQAFGGKAIQVTMMRGREKTEYVLFRTLKNHEWFWMRIYPSDDGFVMAVLINAPNMKIFKNQFMRDFALEYHTAYQNSPRKVDMILH